MTDRFGAEWEDLQPLPLLPASTHKSSQYPMDELPISLRAAANDIATHVQAPVALAAQCVIGAATHLLQTRVNAPSPISDYGMPCSLFLLSLGASGDRKSACRSLAFRCIDQLELEMYREYQRLSADYQAKARSLRGAAREEFLGSTPLPTDPRSQRTDATFEGLVGEFIRGKPAITWDTDEGSQLLAGASLKSDNAGAIVGGLCRGFDRGIFDRLRSRSNVEASGTAYNRRLTIHLLAQLEAVTCALNDPVLVAQGFLPRFLFAAPESIAGTRLLTEETLTRTVRDLQGLDKFWRRCQEIMATPSFTDPQSGEVHPSVLEPTNTAQKIWLDFYNRVEAEQVNGGEYASIRPFAARGGELANRLAAVMSGFEGKHMIEADNMHSACSLVSHSLGEWLNYLQTREADPLLIRAQALLDWLKAKGWTMFHRDRLGNSGPARERPAKRRNELLAVLLEHRQLLSADGKTFRLNGFAEAAETAEALAEQGQIASKQLRITAEGVPEFG